MPPPSPPPPPPPPPAFPNPNLTQNSKKASNLSSNPVLSLPEVLQPGPPNSVLVSLLVYNGWPFADHWEYFVAAPWGSDFGVVVQAAGDVRAGFWLEAKRGLCLRGGGSAPRRMPLAWVDGRLFDADVDAEENGGVVVEGTPRCEFERMLFKVPAPRKTLRAVDVEEDGSGKSGMAGKKITQRNCQTWIVESAEQLVREGIFEQRAADYLRATSIMTLPQTS
ncbi:hypothetical protein N658DRAFT_463895 [Parathielavia hyrcaniae]|uniref:Uncharacterized protein n=1 Tax=Parathielavia hyrcaniae TaxID=113614 RepID=A0AAN6QBH5_9PEZI|nr:hypothetical protein N658DRAFT_463895 [Parathielavia hyrcaniae]